MGANYFKIKRLPMVHQVFAIKGIHPRFQCTSKGNHAIWIGPVKPSAMSHEYQVRIVYEFGDSPKVWVLSPALKPRCDGGRIPHVYGGPRPCLYLPNSGEWRPDRYIADTIIPWTSLWLYYYEVWHATGEWLGGGVHPDPQVVKQERRNDD
jgi:hypothetical protein